VTEPEQEACPTLPRSVRMLFCRRHTQAITGVFRRRRRKLLERCNSGWTFRLQLQCWLGKHCRLCDHHDGSLTALPGTVVGTTRPEPQILDITIVRRKVSLHPELGEWNDRNLCHSTRRQSSRSRLKERSSVFRGFERHCRQLTNLKQGAHGRLLVRPV